MRKINMIVVHCSATPADARFDRDWIRDLHKNRNGWRDIGYHFVIEVDGEIRVGRTLDQVGAHVAGHNKHSIGICLIGGVDRAGVATDNFFSVQKQSLRTLLLGLMSSFPGCEVLGHRDLSPDKDGDGVVEKHEWLKQCPCFDVRNWMADVGLTNS